MLLVTYRAGHLSGIGETVKTTSRSEILRGRSLFRGKPVACVENEPVSLSSPIGRFLPHCTDRMGRIREASDAWFIGWRGRGRAVGKHPKTMRPSRSQTIMALSSLLLAGCKTKLRLDDRNQMLCGERLGEIGLSAS